MIFSNKHSPGCVLSKIKVTVSFGVDGVENAENVELDNLLKNADMALYKAKESGRNRVMLADTRLVIQETPTSAIQMETPPVTH